MHKIGSWLLGLVVAYVLFLPQAAFAIDNQVGDCVGVFFTKPDCSRCEELQPAVAQAIRAGWAIRTINGKQETSLVKRWHVENYPTVVLMRNGREVDRIVGAVRVEDLCRRMMAASTPDSIRTVAAPEFAAQSGTNAVRHAVATTTSQESTFRGQSPSAIVPLATSALAASIAPISNPSTSHGAFPRDLLGASQSTAPRTGESTANAVVAQELRPTNPAEATVRIRVDEPMHEAIGTGTVIDSYQGEALVLTCGHLFRDTQRNPRIIVETFVGGQMRSYPATLIDFRADEADVGLISFRADGPIAVARLMDHREKLKEGELVYSWGCDHGAIPTRRDSRITKLNRYLGEPNVEVYGAPVQGRSGGGLFNSRGELIGVCYAADSQLNEGLYNAPEVVYQQLMRLGLQRLFTNPSNSRSLASASGPAASMSSPGSPTSFAPSNSFAAPAASQRRLTVLVEENGQSQRMEINNPSPEILQALRNQSLQR